MKIHKETGIPDHLTWLLRNLYVGQEATVRIELGTMDWFQIGKWVRQGGILSPCLFNLYAELLFSHSAVSDSLWPYGLQHARLPCPSPSPRVCSSSCTVRWYIMQNKLCKMLGWMTHKLEWRIARRNISNSDMRMIPFQWQKVKRN